MQLYDNNENNNNRPVCDEWMRYTGVRIVMSLMINERMGYNITVNVRRVIQCTNCGENVFYIYTHSLNVINA